VNAAPLGGPVTVQYSVDGIQSVMQNGVPLAETPVAVAPARAVVPTGRLSSTTLTRQPSAILVGNLTGRAVPVRVYSLAGQCVVDAVATTGRSTTIATRSLAAGLYTAVAGNASISFAVQPNAR
jgi:hypothetical protein